MEINRTTSNRKPFYWRNENQIEKKCNKLQVAEPQNYDLLKSPNLENIDLQNN